MGTVNHPLRTKDQVRLFFIDFVEVGICCLKEMQAICRFDSMVWYLGWGASCDAEVVLPSLQGEGPGVALALQ